MVPHDRRLTGERSLKALMACDALTAVLVFVTWLMMMFGPGGSFAARGLWSLKYFTVLSNLLMAAICLFSIAAERRALAGGELPSWFGPLRLAGVTSLTITFVVVMAFLGPVFGYAGMFVRANLLFHAVVPLWALGVFVAFRMGGLIPFSRTPAAVVPVLLYGAGYVANILINGVGQGPTSNDWYGLYAAAGGNIPVGATVILGIFYLLAFLIWLLAGGRFRRGRS